MKWDFMFRNWIGNSKFGLIFMGAKPKGQNQWLPPEQCPAQLITDLQVIKSCSYWTAPKIHNREDLQQLSYIKLKKGKFEGTWKY